MWVPPNVSNFTMLLNRKTARLWTLCAALAAAVACGDGSQAVDTETAVVDPPAECSPADPLCSVSVDQPDNSDLNASNSAGVRYSPGTNSLIIDRVSSLPDGDDDGVPDAADDCPGTPDWISCDNDPTNDGLYQTLFYDSAGGGEAARGSAVDVTADIPQIDVYFLVDATLTLEEEIAVLKAEILNVMADVRASFPDAQFGLGLYREYPLAPLAAAHSQAPYHHILDLTDDDALVQTAVSTLNTVTNNMRVASAATQALYSVASGLGLGDFVPNRGSCPNAPDGDIGYPCFRDGALHVVMNITDVAAYNGPRAGGPQYLDPPFAPGPPPVGAGVDTLPPVEMFPELFLADTAALALDLGDLSGQSLTLMGMSTLLNDTVKTVTATGCETPPGVIPGENDDHKDAVIALRFDSPVAGLDAFAGNTHWPGANVALFDAALLDPAVALRCDGGDVSGVGNWGLVSWAPTTSQQYYLVVDGIIPEASPGYVPEGAFSISIVRAGDSPNPVWLTSNAPVVWNEVETALLASDIRVASVVTLQDPMDVTSPGNADAQEIAVATDALTKFGIGWVTELSSATGEGLDAAISNTIAFARDDSVYTFTMVDEDNPATGIDEREFVALLRQESCAEGQPLECDSGSGNTCTRCDLGAALEYEVVFENTTVSPTGSSQVFDFELVVAADDSVEVERIPVRVMVPNSAAHLFDDIPGSAFYRNVYDSTLRCNTPPERPKWDDLDWVGSTPSTSSIEFQIRQASTLVDLQTAIPIIISITGPAAGGTFNIREELIAAGQTFGLPYLQITALLNPSIDGATTPRLEGWTFTFFCEAAE